MLQEPAAKPLPSHGQDLKPNLHGGCAGTGLVLRPTCTPPDLGGKGLWSQPSCADLRPGMQRSYRKEVLTHCHRIEGLRILLGPHRHWGTPYVGDP